MDAPTPSTLSDVELLRPAAPPGSPPVVPWQIWVAVAMLALEGFGNLILIPFAPVAAYWLAAKCLFVVGLLRRWRWVFVLFLIAAAWHVVLFSLLVAPTIAALNLVLVLLAVSARRHYFPAADPAAAGRRGDDSPADKMARWPPTPGR